MRENGQEKIYRSARIFKRGQFLNKVEQRGTGTDDTVFDGHVNMQP